LIRSAIAILYAN